MSTFFIKRNDTGPSIQGTLERPNGTAVDLTGATVRFHMRFKNGATKVDAAATIVTAASGIVKYPWIAADTDTAGYYQAEWEVTYADSSVETFPNYEFQTVQVYEDVA